MKVLKLLITTVIIIVAIGFGVYYFGSKLVADEVMDQVAVELEGNGQLEAIKQEVQNDPELQAFIAEGKSIDDRNLPFQTKDQAVRVLVKKFSVSEIADVQSKMKNGLSANEKQELFDRFENRLTEEELLALKVLAYKELANE
ncbi:hypothetical protein [Sporosarcina obsidiansis]|uniref:hypothetical protein n=1 Tax=Sporosarcina obsidiansis TaxID=2660748 RepID=UPI00129A6E69|nr:hypothetical protein [Sporosarcina obsidiansis]